MRLTRVTMWATKFRTYKIFVNEFTMKLKKKQLLFVVFVVFIVLNVPKIVNFLFPYPTIPFVTFVDMLDYLWSFVPFMATKSFDNCLKVRTTNSYQNSSEHLYRYVMKPNKKCPKNVDLIWLIKSSIYRNELRLTLRRTWAKRASPKFMQIFLVGSANGDEPYWSLVKEQPVYDDILQGDFADSFLGTADKVIMGLDYVRHECPRAKYYIIADDDSLVLPWNLLPYLSKFKNSTEPLYTGYVYGNRRPIRNPASRWHTPKSLYKCNTYPDYVGGQLIVLNYEAFVRIHDLCRQLELVTMDDIYLATLASVANIRASPLRRRQQAECSDLASIHHYEPELYKNLVVCHGADTGDDQIKLWTELCYSSVSWSSDRDLLDLFC